MAKRQTILRRSKAVEREVQQALWPGTVFAGGAKRPALEQCDLRGEDCDGWPLWGEVKNLDAATIASEGGVYAVLSRALEQCETAIEKNRQDWPPRLLGEEPCGAMRPTSFAVLWPKGSRRPDQRLVMYRLPGWGEPAIITLTEFKRRIVDGQPGEQAA